MSLQNEELLAQAQAWGFLCGVDELGESVIMPEADDWRIQSRGDRWVLVVSGASQVNFYPEDVLKFLERRRKR